MSEHKKSGNGQSGIKKPAAEKSVSRRFGLARVLSKLGYCSRSQAGELIRAGRVRLNGRVCRDPEYPVHLGQDRIEVDDASVAKQGKIYLMLNKPRGLVTTASDEKGRETIYSLLASSLPWLGPVGRLDKASEGLLLLTNDSEWAAQILAPESHLDKTYHVQINANMAASTALLPSLRQGMTTEDGDFLRVKSASVLRGGQRNTWLEVVLDEGKNRHIRRLFAHLNIEVLRLVRVAIGPLVLGELPKGMVRALTSREKEKIDEALRNALRRALVESSPARP